MDLSALRQRLASGEPPLETPHPLPEGDDSRDLHTGALRAAAVLVPIVYGPHPGILLTRRTAHLSSHAGQVAFPGGRIDATDASPEAAALREAEEEIGLAPRDVELAGRLPDYVTGTGFGITPVIGLLPEGLPLSPNPHEVDAIFTLPLATLLDPAAPQRQWRDHRGTRRAFWVWPHDDYYIWGATAGILIHLANRLRERRASAA